MNNITLQEETYLNIAKEIWSFMPNEAVKYVIQYEIEDEVKGMSVFWEISEGIKGEYSLSDYPREKIYLIGQYLTKLKKSMYANWNHCSFTLFDNAEFKVEFAYVDPEDTWPSLFMKGVSDLSREEVEQTYIPIEYWEERVRIKNSKS